MYMYMSTNVCLLYHYIVHMHASTQGSDYIESWQVNG